VKKLFLILIGILAILSHCVPCQAETNAVSISPIFKGELIQLVVFKGDSLMNLCRRYLDSENRWKEIARINRLPHPDKIRPGKKIFFPLAYLKGTPLEGKVTSIQGAATVQTGGRGAWISLKLGDSVLQGSNLKTGPESALEITFEDGSSFFLRSDTEMGIMKAQRIIDAGLFRELYLGSGRILTRVKEATGEIPRFKIHTPSAIASVRGTEFRVAVDDTQKTYAEVLERVVSVDAANQSVDVAQGEGTVVKKGEAPLPPRKLLGPPGPVDLKTIYNTAPVVAFTGIEGALAYRIMMAKDQQGKQLVREKVIKTHEAFNTAGLADGAYYLLTQSIDSIGLEGLPSGAYPFTIRVNPMPPMIQTPRDGAKIKGKSAEFGWLSVSDADRYHLQAAEDREFSTIVLDQADVTGSSFKTDALEYKPYHFRIRSIARDEYQGAWSDSLNFTLTPLPPTPDVDQPAVSEDEISLKSRNLGEGFTYHFQLAKDNLFKEILLDRKTDKPEITIQKPTDPGIYSVRIAAIDSDGDAGAFSAPQNFEIKERFPYGWVGGWLGIVMMFLLLH